MKTETIKQQAGLDKYKEESRRTKPDIFVYVPREECGYDNTNQHFLVTISPEGAWLAFWTSGADEGQANQSVVVSRSVDRGKTWGEPCIIDGNLLRDKNYRAPLQREGAWHFIPVSDEAGGKFAGISSYGFPIIVPKLNRIYYIYNRCNGRADYRYDTGGVLTGRYSEDDGRTWSKERFELPVQRTAGDNADPNIPPNWIVWQIPFVSSREVIAPFTCWNSKHSKAGLGSESHFLRFDNILTEPDPFKLTTTTLHRNSRGLRFPSCTEPNYSFCEEPSLVELSDRRFFCTMRTDAGYIVFSISNDRGETWIAPVPLYRDDQGALMLNPVAACPIWKLKDGRYLLLFYNNKGDANGGHFPCTYDCVRMNRRPAFISVGRENLGNIRCPIRFGPPKMILDTQGVPMGTGGLTEVATYSSLIEDGKDRVLFYPDRKHFLLGRHLPDELLAECDPGA